MSALSGQAGLLPLLLIPSGRTGASHYFFNDSLVSSRFHHFWGGFWGVDWPFGDPGDVGSFGVSDTGWPFGALGFGWPFDALGIDDVLGGLRPRDFGIHYSSKIHRPLPILCASRSTRNSGRTHPQLAQRLPAWKAFDPQTFGRPNTARIVVMEVPWWLPRTIGQQSPLVHPVAAPKIYLICVAAAEGVP
jgi:hypothetical protein